MKQHNSWVLLATLVLAACTRLTPEQQVVSDAAGALGGREAVLAARTLVIEGGGTQYNLGQDTVPGAAVQTHTVKDYRRAIDLAGGRSRTEQTQVANFPYFAGPAPRRLVQGLDGTVGYNVAADGTATRISAVAASDRRLEWSLHPLPAIRAALDPKATLANLRTGGGLSLVDVTATDGATFTLVIDAATKLPLRVMTKSYNLNLGDVVLAGEFADYRKAGNLQLPTTIATRIDDFVTVRINVAKQVVDGATGDLAAPAAAASAPASTAPPPQTVTAAPIARGVTLLAGGSHNSVLVEFRDHLMLIEAPLNEARTLAAIVKARELVPGKPLTQLVNTHHHFDHTAGVRAAVSEGLAVIAHQGNVAFLQEVAARPHTLRPDALSRSPRPLVIEGIADHKTFTDGSMAVTLYAVGGPHSDTMLLPYFPKERLLVEADLYTPGNKVQTFAAGLLSQLKTMNLRIDRIIPIHGTVAPYAQFVKEATAPPVAGGPG